MDCLCKIFLALNVLMFEFNFDDVENKLDWVEHWRVFWKKFDLSFLG